MHWFRRQWIHHSFCKPFLRCLSYHGHITCSVYIYIRTFSSCNCGHRHDLFLTLTKCFFPPPPYQDMSTALLQLTNICSDLNNWTSLSSQWIPNIMTAAAYQRQAYWTFLIRSKFGWAHAWKVLGLVQPHPSPSSSLCRLVALPQLHLTSTFAAVIIAMATRGCCQTETQIWVVISCFHSLHGRFSDGNGLIMTRNKLAKNILFLFHSYRTPRYVSLNNQMESSSHSCY